MKKKTKKEKLIKFIDDDTKKEYSLTWDEYVKMPFNVRLRRLR